MRIEISNQCVFLEGNGRRVYVAIGVGEQGRAIEHDRILLTDDIDVCERDLVRAGALGEQCIALSMFVALEWRSIRDQDQLSAGRDGFKRGLQSPQVLTNHRAHGDAVDVEDAWPTIGIDSEVTPLIKDRVIG